MSKMQRINALLLTITIAFCSSVHGCEKTINLERGANIQMKTYKIGRFSLAVPAEMKLDERTSKVRHVEIEELLWSGGAKHEQTRTGQWDKLIAEIKKYEPPRGSDKVILRIQDFPCERKWAKGVFYHKKGDAADEATWTVLLDEGVVGVLIKGRSVLIEKENKSHLMSNNIENLCNSYHKTDSVSIPNDNGFHLQHGIIALPYSWQEASHACFENHSSNFVLTIDMEMDSRHYRETMGLIEKTKGMLATAALQTTGSMSKIRLDKREVAGMKGEESILRITEHGEKTLLFNWEFNGKEDLGEYPTTHIEMEAPDGNLDEKIKIWDAVLDSMKPVFVRKK